MNKTKRGLMLAGGIVNVVYTAIYAPIMLISLPLAIEILSEALSFGGNVTFADVWGLLSIILLTLVFVASLIVSCFLFPNPDKSQKPKNYFKLLITLIVLNFVIFVLCGSVVVNCATFSGYWYKFASTVVSKICTLSCKLVFTE